MAGQEAEPGSLLWLYRELIALRPKLGPGLELLDAEPGVVRYARGEVTVTIDTLRPVESRVEGGGLTLRSGG